MKILLYILVSLIETSGSAQYAHRRQIITLLLHKPSFAIHAFTHSSPNEVLIRELDTKSALFQSAAGAYIPTYALPRGAIFCRMEDAIQHHTKIKINVGVGGE